MRIIKAVYGIKTSSYALRWAHMITKSAKKRARILAFWDKYGLTATMEAYGVRRSTLYEWKKKLDEGGGKLESLNVGSTRPLTRRSRDREWPTAVKDEIKRIREEHPNLGKDKVQKLLQKWCRRHGYRCPGVSTVGRLIADMGGLRVYPQKIRHDGTIVPKKRGKVLRKPKGLKAKQPGDVVSLDTIERFVHGHRRYVITMTDLYCRFSFAWSTNSHASLAAKEFFELVQQVFPVPIKTILTDNGSEFKKHFANKLQEEHMTHYHTYPKCPRMNAHAERFNRTLQEEFIDFHAGSLINPLSFNVKLMKHLQWHNTERPHFGLGLKSPMEFLVENHPVESRMWWTNTTTCLGFH